MPVDAVLFDLDDTVLSYRRSPADVLDDAFETVGFDPLFPAEAYYARFDEFAERTDSIDDLRRECFAALAAERNRDPALGRDVAEAYTDLRVHGDVEFLPGAPEALAAVAVDHRVGVVTNAPRETQRPKLDALDLDRWVEAVVYAGYDTPSKPAVEPFRRGLDALDATADRAVYVGNSHESDVVGANRAGLTSVWVPTADDARRVADAVVPDGTESDAGAADFRLDSLTELAALVADL